jgi:hypothetical protein
MCDYSLEQVASRPAVVGDELTVTRFGHGTTGFSGKEDFSTAVCLLPGTEIAFDEPIQEGIYSEEKNFGKVAVFTQIIRPEMTWGYHKDGLEFPDGRKILLTHLKPGQMATVLQLPKEQTVSHLEMQDIEAPKVEAPAAPYFAELVRY